MKKTLTILSMAAFVSAASLTWAHGGATGIVKERMELMMVIGKNMKGIAAMVKGEVAFDAKTVEKSAMVISDHAMKINGMFPKGSLDKPTEALPAIWEDWERFSKLSDNLVSEAKTLAEAAASGEKRAVMVQFAKTGKVCSACHTDFRVKKD